MRNQIVLIILALFITTSAQARMYKWFDEEGNVYYSDKVPPDQYSTGRTTTLGKGGVGNEEIKRAKTADEIQRAKELERLRREQERLAAEQKARDQVLLRTFRNEDEIIMTRDGKIASIDSQIRLANSNIKRLKATLTDLQAHAAAEERAGKKVPKKILTNIEQSQRQIETNYATIVKKEKDKEAILAKYDEDLTRFRLLRSPGQTEEEQTATKKKRTELVETVVICPDATACDDLWEKAKAYVKEHATTDTQIMGKSILMTKAPRSDEDISMTVSRIKDKGTGKESIFLDMQCKDTVSGRKHCLKDDVKALKNNFRSSVEK